MNLPLQNLPPLIKILEELVPRNKIICTAERAGISYITIRNWFYKGTDPQLSLFEASLNAVGYRLEIVPQKEE